MSTSPSSKWLNPAALLRIRSLELRARAVMEGAWKGLHRSPHHGFSAEFSEYRPYARGDDPRFIDWKVAARSDRWFVKKFEEETNLRCQLVLDASSSMSYGSRGYDKHDYAATLAATLSLFLMQQGDAVGLTTFDREILDHLPARRRPGQLHALLTHLQRAADSHRVKREPVKQRNADEFAKSLRPVGALVRRRAMVVVLSDFLAPLDGLETQLALFRAMGHEVMLVQTLDPAEVDFPFDQSGAFEDMESGRRLTLDPKRARDAYLAKLQAHLDSLRSLCARQNVTHRLARTDEPLEAFLFEFLSLRSRAAGGSRARQNQSASTAA
jgi:uncharacterized protein (DUF58 family)